MNSNEKLLDILSEVTIALREIHRHLIESERNTADQILERTATPFDFLTLLANDRRFQWLQPLAHLLINLDVLQEEMEEADLAQVPVLAQQIKRLLYEDKEFNPSIARRYEKLMDTEPAFVLAHAQMKKALSQLESWSVPAFEAPTELGW